MNRGGALTIRPEIHLEYVHDVCNSLKRLGVPKVMVLNGHGGNKRENLEPVAPDLMKRLDDMGVTYVTYWETAPQSFYEANLEWNGVRVTPASLRPHLRWSFFRSASARTRSTTTTQN